jgi:hypothetical protein
MVKRNPVKCLGVRFICSSVGVFEQQHTTSTGQLFIGCIPDEAGPITAVLVACVFAIAFAPPAAIVQ